MSVAAVGETALSGKGRREYGTQTPIQTVQMLGMGNQRRQATQFLQRVTKLGVAGHRVSLGAPAKVNEGQAR